MTMPLKPNHLYVAFQYPRDPEMDFELCPELLPENLRWQANGEREFEYTWSFIVTAEINGQVVTKQYSLISGTVPENNPSVMERCIRNEHLLTFSRYIETSVRSPGILASIPRLMVLLEMQPVNTKYFEKFLANHNAVANWPAITWGAHMTHLWARNILVDCKAININDETSRSDILTKAPTSKAPESQLVLIYEHSLVASPRLRPEPPKLSSNRTDRRASVMAHSKS
ncbi:hypothetical protein CHU98_g10238 [Xylaria longipes]|nr:hypothetical protein CHU98_g10238 [Xylaria longipes]